MLDLVAACVYFLFIHIGIAGTRLRDGLVKRLGEQPYRGLFALASLAGLAWMIQAYRHAPRIATWGRQLGGRPAAYILVFVAFVFVVVGLLTPSPTKVGMESRLDPESVRGIVRITRHPFLWGVALWAVTHLVINGDQASLVLFGTLLILALGGTVSIDAKRQRRFGEQWLMFARATSNVPFGAMARGAARLTPALTEIGGWRFGAAIALYALAFYLHGRLGYPLQ